MPTIKELEIKHERMFAKLPDGMTEDSEMSEEDFLAKHWGEVVGLDIEGRKKFLADNGYDETRENMVDASLPTKNTEAAS